MADKQIAASLSLDTKQADQSMGSFKKQLREATQDLQKMAAEFGENSAQAAAAANKVAKLRDTIGDANSLVAAFNPDRKFVAFGQAVQGVVGGFTALQGAMGLLGVNSENVQKQLLKVQSALALTQGLDNIRDSVQGFKNMATVIGGQLVKAFSTLKGAIAATGLGLVVIAIGVLVANFDKISDLIGGIDQKTKELAASSAKLAETEQDKLDSLNAQENTLKLQGKSEKQILDLKIAQTDEIIAAREQQLEAQQELEKGQIAAAKRNADILSGIIRFVTAPINFVLRTLAKVGDFLGITKDGLKKIDATIEEANKTATNFFFDPEEVKKEGDEASKELKKQIEKLKGERDGFKLRIKDINAQAFKNGADDREINRLKNVELDPENDPVVLFEKKKQDEMFKNAEIHTQKVLDLSDLSTKIQEGNAKQLAFTEEQTAQARIAAAGAIGSALGALSDLVGKQTAVGKALGIAQATINTWIGATEVLRAPSILPEPFGTIAKIANVAAIVASGINAVKNIVKTQVPGGGGGSNGSAPSLSTLAPLTASATAGSTRLDQNALNSTGNAAIRAFVVEADVTNNQERITRLNRAARIGG